MLMLHCGAKEVSRRQLSQFKVPRKTDTWSPIGHDEMVKSVIKAVKDAGYEIQKERWGVMDGALYKERPGHKKMAMTKLPGARLYGFLDFSPIRGLRTPKGMGLSMGIRTSFDKTYGQVLMFGGRVFICDNGVLVGEHEIRRKHTSQFDIQPLVAEAFGKMKEAASSLRNLHEGLVGRSLGDTEAKALIVDLADAGAINSSHILPVHQQYSNPTHKEFQPRNSWSLYNATTEIMKRQPPARQIEGFRALNEVMLPKAVVGNN